MIESERCRKEVAWFCVAGIMGIAALHRAGIGAACFTRNRADCGRQVIKAIAPAEMTAGAGLERPAGKKTGFMIRQDQHGNVRIQTPQAF